jgi:hypothetical protein
MFSFPFNTDTAANRNNIASPAPFLAFTNRMLNASLQLQELNRQALRRLVEESALEMQKALQVRTLADAQLLVSEHSKSSLEKFTGYWQNVGNITLETWGSPRRVVGAVEASVSAPAIAAEPAVPVAEAFVEQPAVITKAHETDVHPSPLVEKLVASVAVDPEKAGGRTKH